MEEINYRNFDQSGILGLTGYVGLKSGLYAPARLFNEMQDKMAVCNRSTIPLNESIN